MNEAQIGETLLYFALLLGITYLVAGLFERAHIPGILAALFVAMGVHYTPLGAYFLTAGPGANFLNLLAELGLLFLLFYIGLQIDMQEMRGLSSDIVWLTVLNTVMPFLLGMAVMLALGYGWVLAFVIGVTRMPTAEAVIVPILDEFRLIRTRVGEFIVGAGVLDDVIEVFLVAIVSVWIGQKAGTEAAGMGGQIFGIAVGLVAFLVVAWIAYRWVLAPLGRWLPRRPRNLMMLAMVTLFSFGGFAEVASLGMVVGAIVAGILMRPVFAKAASAGETATHAVQAPSYGFFGLVFFFWVGMSVDLNSLIQAPMLAVLLFLAAFVGKIVGVFIMVPMKKLTVREAWIVGIGLNARLTTEIIVAQLLFTAKLIDVHLFTALVAASSLSTVLVPILFTFLVRAWGDQLRASEPETEASA